MGKVKFHTVEQPESVNDIIYHVHHIIPKHMCGTDDPSNLVKLTIQEHADAHKLLYEQYGHWEDQIAWLGLAGLIGKEEILKKVSANSKGKKRPKNVTDKIVAKQKGQKRSEETKSKMRADSVYKDFTNIGKYERTKEHREKMSEIKKRKKNHNE